MITDAPVDRSASGHTPTHTTPTHTPASAGSGTAASAAGSDGASAEPNFSDPTATPNGNGVSAGSTNPGDSRSSS